MKEVKHEASDIESSCMHHTVSEIHIHLAHVYTRDMLVAQTHARQALHRQKRPQRHELELCALCCPL